MLHLSDTLVVLAMLLLLMPLKASLRLKVLIRCSIRIEDSHIHENLGGHVQVISRHKCFRTKSECALQEAC